MNQLLLFYRLSLATILAIFSLLLQGCYSEGFKLNDQVGLSSLGSVAVPVPTDPVAFNRVSLPLYSKGSFSVNGTCLDGKILTLRVQDASDSSPTCTAGKFQAVVTAGGADGPKVVIISQMDSSGRVWQDSVTITKDTMLPVVTIMSIVKSNSNLVVSGTCEGNAPMTIGGDILSITNLFCSNNAFQFTVRPTVGDGNKNIDVAQTDLAGNRGEARRPFIVDTVAPVLNISSPAASAQFENAFQLRGTCESGLDVIASGTGVLTMAAAPCVNGSYSLSANFSVNLGNKEVIVSQTDASGNRGQASILLVRIAGAANAPAIEILQPAVNTLAKAALTLSGTCTAGLNITISGAVAAPSTTICANGTFSTLVNFSAGEGNKTVTVTQTNSQNISGSVSRNFLKDSVAPIVSIVSPTANTFLATATATVSGVCESGISVVLYGSGLTANVSATCANGMYSGQVILTALDGSKEINVGQTDGAQNYSSATVTIKRDSVAPLIKITDPAAGTMATNGVNLRGTCETGLPVSVSGSGVASPVQTMCDASTFSLNLIFSATDGAKDVTVAQTDGAGNRGLDNRSFTKGALPTKNGVQLYSLHCAGCHSTLANSTKLDRTSAQIQASMKSVPAMSSSQGLALLTIPDIDAIAIALRTTTAEPMSNPFMCQPTDQPTPHALQRLAKSEYTNTIRDLFAGIVSLSELSAELAFFPEELNHDNPFDRGADSMSLGLVQAQNKISVKIASLITASAAKTGQVFSEACFSASPVTDACLGSFVDRFGSKVYRRPVKAAEKIPLLAAYRIGSSHAESAGLMLRALLMSPHFLYHLEYDGTPTDATATALRLSAFELASRLSYLLVNSSPDAELINTATNGSLLNDVTLDAQIKRLLTQPESRTSLRRFFGTWFSLNALRDPTYSTAFKAGIDTTDIKSMAVEEALLFSDYVVFEGKRLEGLMTDNTAFIKSPVIAQIYGISMPITADGRTKLPLSQRSGILTRVARTMSGSDSTSPILRGVAVKRSLLCDTLSAPNPASLPDGSLNPPTDDPLLSTRKRYENKTAAPICMTCHAQINPFGFALENYDSLGRFRTVESVLNSAGQVTATHQVDAVATVNLSAPPDPMVNGGIELSKAISESQKFPMCFAKRWHQFSIRRSSTALDNCSLASTYDNLKNPNATLLDTIKGTIMNTEFKVRRMR